MNYLNLVSPSALRASYNFNPHFSNDQSEVQRDEGACYERPTLCRQSGPPCGHYQGPFCFLDSQDPTPSTEDDATIPSIFHQVQSLSFHVPDLERRRKVPNSQCESLLSRATLTAWGAVITWPAFAPAKPLRSVSTPLQRSGTSPGLTRIRWVWV